MTLQGGPELKARLRAIKTVFKPVGREWADDVVRLAKPRIPVGRDTQGRPHTRDTVRRTNATLSKARVGAFYPVNFIDHGTAEHAVAPKKAKVLRFTVNGKPQFAKRARIPAKAARPFKAEVGRQALAQVDIIGQLIKLWNGAVSGRGGSARIRGGGTGIL